jgi:hypothetical protein
MPPRRRARGWSHTPPAGRAATAAAPSSHHHRNQHTAPPFPFVINAGGFHLHRQTKAGAGRCLSSISCNQRVLPLPFAIQALLSAIGFFHHKARYAVAVSSHHVQRKASALRFSFKAKRTFCRCRFFFHYQQSLSAFGFIVSLLFSSSIQR